jgi:3-oxoacyl-[acyl-carrier protein] reductase
MPAARNVLVTGASGGIGAATARRLAERGARVWLTYASNAAGAERTAEACRAVGAEAVASELDLRSTQGIAQLTDRIGVDWGSLHAVVNNAGSCPYTPWQDISPQEWDAVLETNARGTFLLIAGALPLLRRAQGDRSIVNVASLAGQVGGLTTSIHYAASKAAVLAMTRSFARLLAAEGIRVNAVSPGPIGTGITAQLETAVRDRLVASVPLGRMGEPDDVAQTICLLASPESAFTTGATYDVNGGLRME